jgi:conjugative relaxase-like TrwC/TraI family protein
MLSISPLSGGDHKYYLQLTNLNYYLPGERGEPEGQWFGKGAEAYGLSGVVQREHLERVCNGFHPETGKPLVQNAGILEGDKARKPGDDMTFSAPKTVSALFAVGDDRLQAEIRKAHTTAWKAALNLCQDKAGFSRCGKGGQWLEVAPLMWAAFEHCTSRAGDPQLHTHALLINLTKLENGKSRTVDSTHIYHWKMAMGSVYRAELARGLEKLGFEIERYEKGSSILFRVRGVPEDVVELWSKRRAEIEEQLKLDFGSIDSATSKMCEFASLETRRKKDLEKPRSEMQAGWRQDGEAYGFTPQYINEIRHPYVQKTQEQIGNHKTEIWREAIAKLSYHQAYWSEAEMTKMAAERAAGKLSAAEVRELLAHKMQGDELVTKGQLVTREKNVGNNQYLDRVEEQFTLPRILALEKKFIEQVKRMDARPHTETPRAIIDEVLKNYPTIWPEQKKAVELLTDGGAVRLMSGTAGTGKGFVLKVCHDVWKKQGREVIGIADAGTIAENLFKDTGIRSSTMAMTLIRLDRGWLKLNSNTTLVVDEAGQLGTLPLAKLQMYAERANAQLRYAGDDLQLQPVQAGAPYKNMVRILGEDKEARLTEVQRQNEQWARDAVKDLKAARSAEAIKKFIDHKQFAVTENRREAMQKVVEKWVENGGLNNPDKVVMLAGMHHEVRELATLAQAARIKAGLVDAEKKMFLNNYFVHVGDKVQFKSPSSYYKITNSDTATVLVVDPERQRLTVKFDKDARELTVNVNPTSKRYSADNVRLQYSQTVHSTQGKTVDYCIVLLGGPNEDLHRGYVEGSRAKIATYFFINKQDAGPELKAIIKSLAMNRQKKMALEVFQPKEITNTQQQEQERKPKLPVIRPDDFQQPEPTRYRRQELRH